MENLKFNVKNNNKKSNIQLNNININTLSFKEKKKFLDKYDSFEHKRIKDLEKIEFSDNNIINNLKYDKCLDDRVDLKNEYNSLKLKKK